MMARFVEKPCQDSTGCGFISVSLSEDLTWSSSVITPQPAEIL